jgi:hypothetical protein
MNVLLRLFCMMVLGVLLSTNLFARADLDAFHQVKLIIDEKNRARVYSMHGNGTIKEINRWVFYFYDPESPSKAKCVIMKENGKIDRVAPAEGKARDEGWSFDPTKCKVAVETAVKTAAEYAEKNQVEFDSINVVLRRLEMSKAPVWRVELVQKGKSRGFIYTDAENGTLTEYAAKAKEDSKDLGQEVEDTFRGIGADLEEFFTGKRTVDKD